MTDFDLPAGTQLLDYRIERVLGHGGFGVTYLATDQSTEARVAIKEFLPGEMATRVDGMRVAARNRETQTTFDWGLARFLGEAQMLARFRHPNIVEVLRYFEANGTAYMVMAYVDGLDLFEVMARRGTLGERALRDVIVPLLDGLRAIHRAELLHRDIKPDNIFIRGDGSPVLLDFGAARQAFGRQSRALTTIVTPGYAPHEQYQSKGNQGPWSDIYALAGVLYTGVSGELPAEAPARIAALLRGGPDPLRAARELGRGRYSDAFLAAIDAGLAVREQDRPQNVDTWLEMFRAPTAPAAVSPAMIHPPTAQPAATGPHTDLHTAQPSAASTMALGAPNGFAGVALTPVPPFLAPDTTAAVRISRVIDAAATLHWWRPMLASFFAALAWGLAPLLADAFPLDVGDWRFGPQVFAALAALAMGIAWRALLGGPAALGLAVMAGGWLLASVLRLLLLQAAPTLGWRLGPDMIAVAGAVMGLVGGIAVGVALRAWARPKLAGWAVLVAGFVWAALWTLRQSWAFDVRRAAARGRPDDPTLLSLDAASWLVVGLTGSAATILLWRGRDLKWRRRNQTPPKTTHPVA